MFVTILCCDESGEIAICQTEICGVVRVDVRENADGLAESGLRYGLRWVLKVLRKRCAFAVDDVEGDVVDAPVLRVD